jgi:conjugal transfer pilus assembly protein TraW
MRSFDIRKYRTVRVLRTCAAVLASITLLVPATAAAQDLGVIGPVYPIAEPNLLDVIVARLREAEASGALAKLQRDARSSAKREVEHPAAVATLTKTTRLRSFYYDPTIVVPYPITDAEGRVIVSPGTRVNPLDTVSLSKHLLFFDARDAGQIKRARQLLDRYRGRVKLILTGGSYLDLAHKWKLPIYYDQQGTLTEKLRIGHVPALVSQEGKRLRIDEIL